MGRSGRRGTSSAASFGSESSDQTKKAIAVLGLPAARRNLDRIISEDPKICQAFFFLYDECMRKENDTKSCEGFHKQVEACGDIKRDPRYRSWIVKNKEYMESRNRKATAAGFRDYRDYIDHKWAKDPAMCRSVYKLYQECISKHGTASTHCENFPFKGCPQFKKGS